MRYLQLVSGVLDNAIHQYSGRHGIPPEQVDRLIGQHITNTQQQHFSELPPDIDYDDPLCRLGYLFTHAGANAYLFETVLRRSVALQSTISEHPASLSVCTVGGGPGTEMMGLCKYLADAGMAPQTIRFTVLDRVQEWLETWYLLETACTAWLRQRFGRDIPIAPSFQQMDVTDPNSCARMPFLFQHFQMIVFNYLLSENKVHMESFFPTLARMVEQSVQGTAFLFIDRHEQNEAFSNAVLTAIQSSRLVIAEQFTIGGCMDGHPESDLGSYPARFGRRPRRWFRDYETQRDSVFVVVCVKV